MNWTTDEMNAAAGDYLRHGFHPDALRRVMTRAVELKAARGGTMTPVDVATALIVVESGEHPKNRATAGRAIRGHISAKGARIAVLEAENERCLRLASEACAKSERLEKEGRRRLSSMRPLISQLAALSVEMAKVVGEPIFPDGGTVERLTVTGSMHGKVLHHSETFRYPCSPTCTHDDAAAPGHAERSEAVAQASDHGAPIEDDCERCESPVVQSGEEQASDAYDEGAEAMRAACWEAAQVILRQEGVTANMPWWNRLKAAIEGATP